MRPRRVGKLIRLGDDAQRRGDWKAAHRYYEEIVAARPDHVDIWVQLGHAAKELGHYGRAEQAYREALQRGGSRADTYLQLGHLLKVRGMREGAVSAYAEALRCDPEATVALDHLISLGARDAVPDAVFDRSRRDRMIEDISRTLGDLQQRIVRHADASNFPLRRYDLFRRSYPVLPPPPPRQASGLDIRILIDARHAPPAELRATLVSLLDQSFDGWTACVRVTHDLLDHPVGSFSLTDARIELVERDEAVAIDPNQWVVSLPAGVSLDPHCLAWFAYAASAVDADAFHADHDHVLDDYDADRIRIRPCFYGAFDPYLMIQTSTPPPVVMARGGIALRTEGDGDSAAIERNRRVLLAAGEVGTVAHIPRVLSSIVEPPKAAREAPAVEGREPVAPFGALAVGERLMLADGMLELRSGPGADPVAVALPADDEAALRVVIPSRDAAAMLRTMVERLLACATRRDRVRLTIVDNRSSDPEALALLDDYRRDGIDVLVMDEPFNWSRANNLAAASSREPYLVFANNDTEMLTPGWDSLVVGFLEREDVGVVGARLLYPNRTLQHGGTVFTRASPRHEGVGVAADVSGPLGRWTATRLVGAVTGAFLAVRRDRFEHLGGFDEQRLAIAFNDVDFCLKVRSQGWRILYTGAIELVHKESKTRGLSDTRAKIAWDFDEFRTLRGRWGDALHRDPGYNPQWTDGPVPFDGLREPSMHSVIDHMRRSADRNPWRTEPLEPAGPPPWGRG